MALRFITVSKEESNALVRARDCKKETSIRETTMMTTGDGELFSEDGWPVRAEIKKTGLCSQRSDPNQIRLGQKAR